MTSIGVWQKKAPPDWQGFRISKADIEGGGTVSALVQAVTREEEERDQLVAHLI